jgi:hypothetical protein
MKFIRFAKAFSLGITILSFSSAFAADTARDIVLLMANSERMQTHDPQSLTRKAIMQFLQSLQASTRVAIVTYGELTQRITPFSPMGDTNANRLLKQLNAIIPQGRHRNHAAGLERAIYELKTKGRSEAQKLIIFLNDGPIDTGDRTQDLDFAKWLREILAQEAADAGIRVYGIAFTENADMQSMQTLVHKTSGSYYRAVTAEDIQPAFVKILSAIKGNNVAQAPTPARPRPPSPAPLLEYTIPRRQPPTTVSTAPQSTMTQGIETHSQFAIPGSRSETPTTLHPPLPSPASPQQSAATPSKASLAKQKNSAGYEFPTRLLLLALFIGLGLTGLSIVMFFIMRNSHAAHHTPPTKQTSSGLYRDDLGETVMARIAASPKSSLNAGTSGSTVANPTLSPTQREVSASHMEADDHPKSDAYNTSYEHALRQQEAKLQHRSHPADDTIFADPPSAKNRSQVTQLSPSIKNHVVKHRQIRKGPMSVGHLEENHAGSRLEYSHQNEGIRTEQGSDDFAQRNDTEELAVDTRLNAEPSSADLRDDPAQQAEKRGDTEELSLEDINQTILISHFDKDDDEKTAVTPTKFLNIETHANQRQDPPPDDPNKTVVRPINK